MSAGTLPRASRAERVAVVRRLRDQGLLLREIADRTGLSPSYVQNLAEDPENLKGQRRRDSYRRPCPGFEGAPCGRLMTGSEGLGADAPKLCAECARLAALATKFWTRERIIEAIQCWAHVHGKPPGAMDWIRSARDGECPHPCFGNVYGESGVFTYWADAVEAAGFPRPVTGRYERTPEWRERMRALRTHWRPELIVAAIQEWVEIYGIPPRNIDWNPSLARLQGKPELAEPFLNANGRYPHIGTVRHQFGTLSAAVRAAGFKPRKTRAPYVLERV